MAHAYLISTNNIDKCYEVLLKVIKNIFCNEEYSDDCHKCSLCHLIDLNNLPSLKVIMPDGAFIKKEQVLELKYLFSKDSQYTKENIYVIKKAEKMNKEAANTMLKFLEEPDGSVIGFFITNHKESVLPTIISRCQLIEVNFVNEIYEEFNTDKDTYEEMESIVKEYLLKVEIEKKDLILYNRRYLSELDKDKIILAFQIMLNIYQKKLRNKCYNIVDNNLDFLNKLSIEELKKRINLIIELLKELNYNVNLDLLLDRFVIEMVGI